MTMSGVEQKFDLRWILLWAASVLLSSVSLLRLLLASAAFVTSVAASMLLSGLAARRFLTGDAAATQLAFVERVRTVAAVLTLIAAAALNHSNKAVVMTCAAVMLWTVSVNSFLQIGARFAPAHSRFLPYVQFMGDLWVAIFLAVWGADWMLVAAVLAFAAPSAVVMVPERSPRLLPVVILCAAAIFLFGIPASARLFAVYLASTIALCSWSAHHLILLANHLRPLKASASDGSAGGE